MRNFQNGFVSMAAAALRGTRGAVAHGHRRRPAADLVLYDAESSPYCRYVREALTELDLDVMIRPVPQGGTRFRAELAATSGGERLPYLIDPGIGMASGDAEAIVRHLYTEYGREGAKVPGLWLATSVLTSMLRGRRGVYARPSRAPERPLELYSFEASPFSRLVRETMCELELPYLLRNVGKAPGAAIEWMLPDVREKAGYRPATDNRRRLAAIGGRVMVPYLVDPNTGTAMYESADIQAYLLKTYAV